MKNQTSQYGSCLIFNVGESRYRSKKTSVPGFFFAANGGMSVSDVIMPKERKAFCVKYGDGISMLIYETAPLVDKKSAMSKLKIDRHF